ncbi:FecR domain-containing protein [Microvirga antarctica]|uniref:FecR domain-containing protein n=1 Tax=Microvirga antarctica TaxID=2819233 RepID=UPI001B30DA7C|nr:FecR domain-containing protein [Microvirga antarctica]
MAVAQSPIPRPTAVAGSIVAVKGGEELRFVREEAWRAAEIRQDVVGGDVLRTNALGNLAILFADRTQIRVGRNSTLSVNQVASSDAGTTDLTLQSGTIWARAARGGSGVDVKTPAAVAAIRGTDWSMSVDGSGKTGLVVLEGVVELKNAQGSVTVRQGEGAVASIGQAPTKFVLVNSNDREQMLFYLTLRDAFTWLPASPLKSRALREQRARIEGIPKTSRSTGDWLDLAEAALALDGRAVAKAALAEARSRPLDRNLAARADLVAGLLAGSERRWSDAASLFSRAEKGLDSKRRISAAYGRYIAASLADPKRVQPEPAIGRNDAEAALARAYILGFKQDLKAAFAAAKEAEKRFPGDARLAVFSAQVALALNEREAMREAVARARRIDPDDPEVLLVSGVVRGDIDGEVVRALTELRQAAATAPGQAEVWNTIGLFESDRGSPIAAEEALRRAIVEDPQSPVAYANLAILLLDQSRVDEAGTLIDKALELDPSFNVGYVARGRYFLQKGETAKGIEAALAGSTANPAYSQGLLVTAIAYYQNGDDDLAMQALDNADRLDPNDPVVSVVRTAIALDAYQADEAVRAARETVRRYRLRGGDYAGLAVNRDAGSYPAQAYRFIDLDEWARFYGDRVFDPFTASSYFDQAVARRQSLLVNRPSAATAFSAEPDLTSFNLTIQGLFFDPLAVSARVGRQDLVRRPFIDTEIGGSLLVRNRRAGWGADATVQGFSNDPAPTSFSLTAGRVRAAGRESLDNDSASNASLFVGMAPDAVNRFLIFGSASNEQPGLAAINTPTRYFTGTSDNTAMQAGAGWSHSFADRNVLTGAVYANRGFERRFVNSANLDLDLLTAAEFWQRNRTDGVVAALNHSIGINDLTFRYGIEGQVGSTFNRNFGQQLVVNRFTGESQLFDLTSQQDADFRANRIYADAFWRPSDRFEAQVGIQRTSLSVTGQPDETTVSPRIGIGVSPLEGHWLRAAYRQDGELPLSFTLAPVTTLGLVPNSIPVALGGRTDTLALRWDAEWSPHFFTAVDYQHQDVRFIDLPVANTFDTIAIGKASVDRLAATANLWLGGGIGVFGTVGTNSSEIRSEEAPGRDVPLVADRFARAGVTFVHPSRLKLTIAGTYVGDRARNLVGGVLDDYWTADAAITWETPDRRLMMGVTVLNILNTDYEMTPGIPGPTRAVAATLKARF